MLVVDAEEGDGGEMVLLVVTGEGGEMMMGDGTV